VGFWENGKYETMPSGRFRRKKATRVLSKTDGKSKGISWKGQKGMLQQFLWVVVGLVCLWMFRQQFLFGGQHMNVTELNAIWKAGKGSPTEVLVDVREPGEFAGGHVAGARNIPLGDIVAKASDLKGYTTVYVICLSGARSNSACNMLKKVLPPDTKLINIDGGTGAWIGYGFPVEK
jgi:rhodanese-related sulfurtransferase